MMDLSLNKTTRTTGPPLKIVNIEVGLIIMGLSCVCVVAFALIILQLRSIRKRRQQLRRRQRSSATASIILNTDQGISGVAAPPSYETVIRNPHLYPVSPRSSIASITSMKNLRRASDISGNSSSIRPEAQSVNGCQSNFTLQLEDLEDPPPPFPGRVNDGFVDIQLLRTYYDDMDTETRSNRNRNRCHEGTINAHTRRIRSVSDVFTY